MSEINSLIPHPETCHQATGQNLSGCRLAVGVVRVQRKNASSPVATSLSNALISSVAGWALP